MKLRRRYLIFFALLLLYGGAIVLAASTLSFFLLSLIAISAGLLLAYYLWNCRLNVMFEPSSLAISQSILEIASIQPGEVIYDLGCGDARILIMAARRYGAQGVGVEIDLMRVLLGRLFVWLWGVRRQVHIYHASIKDVDLSMADVVVLFLSPEINLMLKAKLANELRLTARVVSNWHCIPGWRPTAVRSCTKDGGNLFLYDSQSWQHNEEYSA